MRCQMQSGQAARFMNCAMSTPPTTSERLTNPPRAKGKREPTILRILRAVLPAPTFCGFRFVKFDYDFPAVFAPRPHNLPCHPIHSRTTRS